MKSEMAMFAVALLVLGVAAVDGKHAAAPAPAVDCDSLVVNLIDCLSFVTNGSTDVKPGGKCCSGLKTVLRTDADCLCKEFKNSGNLGVSLNVTKALTLPAVCHLSAPSIKNCGVSAAVSPSGSSVSSPAGAPGSSTLGSTGASAPSPTSGKNASPALGVSLSSVVLCLVGAIFSSL